VRAAADDARHGYTDEAHDTLGRVLGGERAEAQLAVNAVSPGKHRALVVECEAVRFSAGDLDDLVLVELPDELWLWIGPGQREGLEALAELAPVAQPPTEQLAIHRQRQRVAHAARHLHDFKRIERVHVLGPCPSLVVAKLAVVIAAKAVC